MLKISKYLKKSGYDLKSVDGQFHIINIETNNKIKIDQLEFEKLLFMKMIDLLDELEKDNEQ